MIALSMKPTGWFHIGWSGELPPGGAKPMKYFGHELVAFRGESGELGVLDAHCRHLGAHLGYESKVHGNCIACPYHGWEWDTDGNNTLVPYQERPTKARQRKWHTRERNGLIYLWHDPNGGDPRPDWELPSLFDAFPDIPVVESDFHAAYPSAIVDKPSEPIHPQLIQENSADSMHFRYAHSAPEDPEVVWFEAKGPFWRSQLGFKSPKTKQVKLTLRILNHSAGVSFATFNGAGVNYRLVLSATPVDDTMSDLRVSYFLPREPASPDALTDAQRAFAHHTIELFEQDARIWRHQVFVQKPVFARQDIAPYTALRKWAEQFYEVPEGPTPTLSVVD